MRIGGLASGIDTEQLMEQLMQAERIPVDRLFQRKVQAEWKRDAYRSVNSKLLRLSNSAFDLRLQASYRTKAAVSSNESLVSAAVTGASQEGTLRIKVDTLAKSGSLTVADGLSERFQTFKETAEFPTSIYLRGLDGSMEEIVIEETDDIDAVLAKINNNKSLGINAFYDSYKDSAVLTTKGTGVAATIQIGAVPADGIGFFTDVLGINAVVADQVSVTELASAGQEVSLTTEAIRDGFVLSIGDRTYGVWDSSIGTYPNDAAAGEALGADVLFDLAGVTGDKLDEFLTLIEGDAANITDAQIAVDLATDKITIEPIDAETAVPVVAASYVAVQGSNAHFSINGLATERTTNSFTINGTNITLHAETDQEVTIEVKQDVEQAFENIKEFVDLYNEIIEEVTVMLHEPRYRDYPPLTDQQKEEMSDREIELWEERAKSGMLRNDSLVSGILADLRLALSSAVEGLEGEISSLSQIGITTGPWEERGKLHIDETKLKQALENNLDDVVALFTQDSENPDELGIARKLDASLKTGMDRIISTAGRETTAYDQSFLGEQIRRFESRISDMEERLVQREQRYWNQFIAMERAMDEMNRQSEWLYQQLAALSGGR